MPPLLVARLTLRLHFTAVQPNHVFLSPFNVAVKLPSLSVDSRISVSLRTLEPTVFNRLIARVLVSFPTSVQTTALVKDPLPTVLVRESAHSDTQHVLTTAVCLAPIRSQTVQSYQPALLTESR
jgi:hypothetical protein